VWQELPNQTGTVKGSVLVTECEECKTKREQANADRAAKEAKALALKEVEDLIEAKKRDLAVEALKVDGILDSDAKITPAGKEFLAGDKKPIK
jgi:hypothetical protein